MGNNRPDDIWHLWKIVQDRGSPAGDGSARACRSFAAKGLLPAWYMALRLPLTLAAVSGMGITLVGSLMASTEARAARQ